MAADFKYGFFKNDSLKITIYSIFGQKYSNNSFLVPNLSTFVLHKILELGKLEGVYLKYDNSFLKF